MTTAERREYMREYRRLNRERIREQQKIRETRLAVAALENVERVTDDVCIVKTTGGREFKLLRESANA
jgi:hypothetical protein